MIQFYVAEPEPLFWGDKLLYFGGWDRAQKVYGPRNISDKNLGKLKKCLIKFKIQVFVHKVETFLKLYCRFPPQPDPGAGDRPAKME